MEKQLVLNENLKPSFTSKTLYELLGVNIDSSFSEINENYWALQHLIDEYPSSFSSEDKNLIDEARNKLVSNLGRVYYESRLNSEQIHTICEQYKAKNQSKEMFDKLNSNIRKYVTVLYMEKYPDNENFSISKTCGVLTDCVEYDKISMNNHDISFLGYDSAIIEITNDKGDILYTNQYLKKFQEQYNKDNVNNFREVTWSFYIAKMLDVKEQNKEKKFTKIKKI